MSPAHDRFRLAIAAGLIAAMLAPAGAVAANNDNAADIRDIRLSGDPPMSGRLLALGIGAGLVALVGGAYVVLRRRRGAPLRSFEIALQELEAARRLLDAGRTHDYCVAVSQIVRRYLEAGFRIPIVHRTTEEFLAELASRVDSPLARHRARLEDFLHGCDVVKFGGAAPTPPDLESLHRGAADLVRETTAEAHDAVPAT